jgi:hypothetical protein
MTALASHNTPSCDNTDLPDVQAPAPWTLTGQGYLIALKMPEDVLDSCTFTPSSLRSSRRSKLSLAIYVSSQASVTNGRSNWGIPKDRCDFEINFNDSGTDSARLTADNGDMIAELVLSSMGPKLPLPTNLVPKAIRTLSQVWEGLEYTLTPSTTGHGKWAKVIDWKFNSDYFPDLAKGRCIAAIKITDFTMVFPEPRIQSWRG